MTEEQTNATEETVVKSFDDMLKENDYQSEFDKKVAKALETAKTKWQEEADAKRTEAEKLAKMKDDEKHRYELEKATKEKDEAIAKLNAYELEKQAIKIATEKGLDISLLEDIDYTKQTADTISTIIDTKKEVFDKAVEKAINEKFKEKTPKVVLNETSEKPRVSRSSY